VGELFGGLLSVNFWKIFGAKVNKAAEREKEGNGGADDKGAREENLASLYGVGWGRIKAEGRQWHARLLAATTRRQHSTLTRISAACNINIHAR
jgi:hypothetical protein